MSQPINAAFGLIFGIEGLGLEWVVQLITLSLPTRVEVELGWGWGWAVKIKSKVEPYETKEVYRME